jgi:hypothetical protein
MDAIHASKTETDSNRHQNHKFSQIIQPTKAVNVMVYIKGQSPNVSGSKRLPKLPTRQKLPQN